MVVLTEKVSATILSYNVMNFNVAQPSTNCGKSQYSKRTVLENQTGIKTNVSPLSTAHTHLLATSSTLIPRFVTITFGLLLGGWTLVIPIRSKERERSEFALGCRPYRS